MVRFYLVPVVLSTFNARIPKYLAVRGSTGAIVDASWSGRDYGDEPSMLIAVDATDLDDAALAAQPDVTKFADDLDTPLGAGLDAMQAALVALKLPAQMLTAQSTARQVVRGIIGIFSVAQCMQGKGRNIFAGGVTLATTVGQIPAAPRADLSSCMTSLGYDIAAVTLATTIQQLLTGIATTASPITMLGVTI